MAGDSNLCGLHVAARTAAETVPLCDCKRFSQTQIPPLNKKGVKAKTQSKAVMKRVVWLSQFFTELQRDQTLRSSELFGFFLSAAQQSAFEGRKKEIVTKLPTPASVFEIRQLRGTATTGLSDQKLALATNVRNYTETCQTLYAQLLLANEDTTKVMRLLADALARNADIYRQMAIVHANIEVLALSSC